MAPCAPYLYKCIKNEDKDERRIKMCTKQYYSETPKLKSYIYNEIVNSRQYLNNTRILFNTVLKYTVLLLYTPYMYIEEKV